jgi:three-Cys-motif partner protein
MAAIKPQDFFSKKRNTSEIKSEILLAYFKFWAGLLLHGQQYKKISEVIYIDMFAGLGKYKDNDEPSTPIKILESLIESESTPFNLNKGVRTFFNDENSAIVKELDTNLKSLPFYKNIIHKPIVQNAEANKNILSELLDQKIPSLTFIDPFGYNYSMEMLLHAVKEWGSDLFMLFNINRIRAAVTNPLVENLMNEIFQDKLQLIRKYYEDEERPKFRETFILNSFENLFTTKGYRVFRFKINFPGKNQTSHYLYLVTKVAIAYLRIKEIMKFYSDIQPDGVPLFTVNSKETPIFYPEVAEYSILKLSEDLINNRQLYNKKSIEDIYINHSIGTNYIKDNYKAAISNLLEKKVVNLTKNDGKPTEKITYSAIINFI